MTDDLGPAKTFFVYMDAVMASDLTPTQRLVLLVQAKHADAHNSSLTNSYPTQETLALETGISESTIKRERKKLAELGWLVQTHSGRGGSSKLANSYDLYIPDDLIARLEDAESKGHGEPLQRVMVTGQRVIESRSKGHGDPTSSPSSAPRSTPVATPSPRRLNQPDQGTKEGPGDGDSYWVGYSKRHPEGYFHPAGGGAREPKGNHVRVNLTGTQVRDAFSAGDYEQTRGIMLGHARDAGLRPAPGPAGTRPGQVPARDDRVRAGRELSRAEREQVAAFEEERRRYLTRTPGEKRRAEAEYRRQMDVLHR